MLVQQSIIGALGSCAGREEYYRSTLESVLAQQSNIGALGRLCMYSIVRYEQLKGCAGTAQYYRITQEAVLLQPSNIGVIGYVVLVQKSNIGALGRLCMYSIVRYEQSKGCAGTAQYYTITQEAVLLQPSNIGVIGYVVLVQKSNIGALGRLCMYSIVRYEQSKGCAGSAQYYTITQEAVLLQPSNIGVIGYVVLVQKSTKVALGRLCWYSRVL